MTQSPPPSKLLIATRNPGKMREYHQLLQDIPFELVSLDDLGISQEVAETAETFEENARLKAGTYARLGRSASEAAPMLVLADDSGLEVDALGGEPGVRSARYGGDACASDEDRVALLLSKLARVPWEKRTARFCCVIAIYSADGSWFDRLTTNGNYTVHPEPVEGWPLDPAQDGQQVVSSGNLVSVVGSVAGMIQYEPQGDQGFGYDPVFYLPSYQRTMAQLPLPEKNRISHRSDAARKAVAVLKQLSAVS